MKRCAFTTVLRALPLLFLLRSGAEALPPLVVTASRQPLAALQVPVGVNLFDLDDLAASPALTADDFLRQVPGFGLFRRSGSLTANPTTQGFTLRGIAPSGTSRGLILFDGAPLNDAFGGWVAWSRIDLRQAERVEVIRGGGATAWGNAALSGVIQILPAPIRENGGELGVVTGTLGTLGIRSRVQAVEGNWGTALEGTAFRTDGAHRLAPGQRGPVDTRADSRHESLAATLEHQPPLGPFFRGRFSYFQERRNNGTRLTNNETESWRWQHRLTFGEAPEGRTAWTAFAERSEYASTFSNVSPDRGSERLVLDQFSVPALALGTGISHERAWHEKQLATFGGDLRWIRGETRERVIAPNLLREAGGEQSFLGLYAENLSPVGDSTTFSTGLRMDIWHSHEGFFATRPFDRPGSGNREAFSDRTELLFSPRLGATTALTPEHHLRAAVYQGFRVPTLNELYRPFQVGADRTFANEELDPERLTGAEIGWLWSPGDLFSSDLTFFWNDVEDTIANVTLGPNDLGGADRQRQNLDRTRTRGLEWEGRLQPEGPVEFFLRHALLDSRIRRAAQQPELEGNRLAQVAEHQGTLGMRARLGEQHFLSAMLRYESHRFENDTNTRRLAGFSVIDLLYRHQLTPQVTLSAGVENLLDRRYADGIFGDGLATLGSPRLLTLSAAWTF